MCIVVRGGTKGTIKNRVLNRRLSEDGRRSHSIQGSFSVSYTFPKKQRHSAITAESTKAINQSITQSTPTIHENTQGQRRHTNEKKKQDTIIIITSSLTTKPPFVKKNENKNKNKTKQSVVYHEAKHKKPHHPYNIGPRRFTRVSTSEKSASFRESCHIICIIYAKQIIHIWLGLVVVREPLPKHNKRCLYNLYIYGIYISNTARV